MKKKLLCILLFNVCLMMTGCQKENQPDNPDNPSAPEETVDYATAVLGAWDVALDRSYESYQEPDYEEITYCSDWASALRLTFNPDGTLGYSATVGGIPDEWEDRYTVHGDTLVWDVKEYKILRLDEHEMVIESKVVKTRTTRGGQTYEVVTTKHYEMSRL